MKIDAEKALDRLKLYDLNTYRDAGLIEQALRDLEAEITRLKDAVAKWEGEHSLALIRAASADGLLSEVLITAGQQHDMRQLLQRIRSHLQGAGDEA